MALNINGFFWQFASAAGCVKSFMLAQKSKISGSFAKLDRLLLEQQIKLTLIWVCDIFGISFNVSLDICHVALPLISLLLQKFLIGEIPSTMY